MLGKSGGAGGEVARRLSFFKGLQAVTTRIHATRDIDEIILDLSADLCALFEAERMTIYTVDESRTAIVSKVKTGNHAVSGIRLAVSDTSVAGYVALFHKPLNIRNVYDPVELQAISPHLQFRREREAQNGLRIRQMLVAPILDPEKDELLGVIEFINTHSGEPFSAFAEEGLLGLTQTLGVAFARRNRTSASPRSRFDALVLDGRLTANELEEATRSARQRGTSVEEVLVNDLSITLNELGLAASRFYALPYEPYRADRIKPSDLLRHIKRDYVHQNHWLPLEEGPEGLVVVAVDPEQVRASRMAQNVFPRARIVYRVTTGIEFERTVDQFFDNSLELGSVGDLLSELDEELESNLSDDVTAASDNELVKLVNKIIIDAYNQKASDIHIEPRPGKEKTLVRFRRDGTLQNYIEVPASYRNALVTRVKIMCDMDISERRKPQDGKIRFRKFAPLDIELRVATLPTTGGVEDVVMRILGNSEPIPLDKIGLSSLNLDKVKEIIAKPYGIFFVCGPTGSGKTTTLHSILSYLNTPETKIWTIEDPVEITQKGLRQVQVNRKAGVDFPGMLRSFLRADPDVIMVGEMRDRETVMIGIEASLTGHLVFSTLHTNSAPESIVRLLDMGMDPFTFSDALLGVLAQRLAKRLCKNCKVAYEPDEAEIEALLDEYCQELSQTEMYTKDPGAVRDRILSEWKQTHAQETGRFTLYRPVGCNQCNGGYRGRVGLFELMPGTEGIKHLVQERGHVSQLFSTAVAEGMRTLKQDGIGLVLDGVTDIRQIRKVCMR